MRHVLLQAHRLFSQEMLTIIKMTCEEFMFCKQKYDEHVTAHVVKHDVIQSRLQCKRALLHETDTPVPRQRCIKPKFAHNMSTTMRIQHDKAAASRSFCQKKFMKFKIFTRKTESMLKDCYWKF